MSFKLRTLVPAQSQNVEKGASHDQEDGWKPKERYLAAWHETWSFWIWIFPIGINQATFRKDKDHITRHKGHVWRGSTFTDVISMSLGLRLVDIGASAKFQSKPRKFTTPTLTKTRAAGGGFWLTKLERRLLPKDSWLVLFLGASKFKPLFFP